METIKYVTMNYRLRFALILLFAAIAAPLFLATWVTISTPREEYGYPVFVRVEYRYDGGRKFERVTVTPNSLIGYFSLSTILGFAAGGVLYRRKGGRDLGAPHPAKP